MKKLICGILSVILLILSLSSCSLGCKHVWNEATCTTPKTCKLCGKTEGEALPHDWAEATCDSPKTCMSCGREIGKALGHEMVGKSCLRCGYEEWSVENFGFYDFDKCNKFMTIDSYNLTDNFVRNRNYTQYGYEVYEFMGNYAVYTRYDGDSSRQGKITYNVIDNDNIRFRKSSLRIIERIILDEENNYLILKCLDDGDDEFWLISYYAIDWSKSPSKKEADDEYILEFYLK